MLLEIWGLSMVLAAASLPQPVMAMTPLHDHELDDIAGQAVFVADHIVGSGTGAGFEYTRVGLDADIYLNTNINKLQLGCGGYNQSIRAGCDIDLDFVSLMGKNGSGGPGGVNTDFRLTRPYVEIATTGSNAATREVVGIKIGAQEADGYMSIGRHYPNGQYNYERGGTCQSGGGEAARIACHSGINMISGNMNIRVQGHAIGCGYLLVSLPFTPCNLGTGGTVGNPASWGIVATFDNIINVSGTRLYETDISMSATSFIGIPVDAHVLESLRFIHGMVMNNTPDFFLSFQRQKVSYPNYAKTGYSPQANLGWWMNVPSMEMTGLVTNVGTIPLLTTVVLGLENRHLDFGQRPAQNCYGQSTFC